MNANTAMKLGRRACGSWGKPSTTLSRGHANSQKRAANKAARKALKLDAKRRILEVRYV